MRTIPTRSLTVRGFINDEFTADLFEPFVREVSAGVASGTIRYREDVTGGISGCRQAAADEPRQTQA